MNTIKITKTNAEYDNVSAATKFVAKNTDDKRRECLFSIGGKLLATDGFRLLETKTNLPAGAYEIAKNTKTEILLAEIQLEPPQFDAVLKSWVNARDAQTTKTKNAHIFCCEIAKKTEGFFNTDFLKTAFDALKTAAETEIAFWQMAENTPLQLTNGSERVLIMPLRWHA